MTSVVVTTIILVAVFCFDFSVYAADHVSTKVPAVVDVDIISNCTAACSTTADCAAGLSCFHATNEVKGCCLKALKPNETGCIIDDQCKRACESTHCDTKQTPARCLCDPGSHFLFNKCWKKCPEFAHLKPVVDEASGFSQCVLKVDAKAAASYMRRFRRQLRSNFC